MEDYVIVGSFSQPVLTDDVLFVLDLKELDLQIAVGLENWSKVEKQLEKDLHRSDARVFGTRVESLEEFYSMFSPMVPTLRTCRLFTQCCCYPVLEIMYKIFKDNAVFTNVKFTIAHTVDDYTMEMQVTVRDADHLNVITCLDTTMRVFKTHVEIKINKKS